MLSVQSVRGVRGRIAATRQASSGDGRGISAVSPGERKFPPASLSSAMENRLSEMYESLTDRVGDWDPESVGLSESAVTFAAAMLGGMVARQALKAGWQATFRREPPTNPASRDVDWSEALLWGVASGAMIGTLRIIARRGASGAYRKVRRLN